MAFFFFDIMLASVRFKTHMSEKAGTKIRQHIKEANIKKERTRHREALDMRYGVRVDEGCETQTVLNSNVIRHIGQHQITSSPSAHK